MQHDSTRCPPGTEAEGPHWVEVTDAQGRLPARLLGPYPSARQAGRACRGFLRLLNVARYTAVVRSQAELQDCTGSASWQTASMLCPSGSSTKAP